MAGVVVLLAIRGQQLLDVVHRLYVMGKSEELTPFLGVISLACACNCAIFVGHLRKLVNHQS